MIYCYACECGNKTERHCSLAEFSQNIECPECGGRMGIDPTAQHCRTQRPSCWPMESDAAGVHPDQVKEAAAYAEQMGVPTEYNPKTGNPIFTGRNHRKRFCEISGLRDRNAGYGDASGKTTPREKTRGRRHAS